MAAEIQHIEIPAVRAGERPTRRGILTGFAALCAATVLPRKIGLEGRITAAVLAPPAPPVPEILNLKTPQWFIDDVARRAQWLPNEFKSPQAASDPRGVIENLCRERSEQLRALDPRIPGILAAQNIPGWMIALVSGEPGQQANIGRQLIGMAELAGPAPANKFARRFETLLVFAASAKLRTPGDAKTGKSLGQEGCSAAISKYILAQMKLDFPELAGMDDALTTSQSSAQMLKLFKQQKQVFSVRSVPFLQMRQEYIPAGSIIIAEKSDGTHEFGTTRVKKFWGWDESDRVEDGNTGLGDLNEVMEAQEFVGPNSSENHNKHGQFLSRMLQRGANREIDLESDYTNVYYANALRAQKYSNVNIITFN